MQSLQQLLSRFGKVSGVRGQSEFSRGYLCRWVPQTFRLEDPFVLLSIPTLAYLQPSNLFASFEAYWQASLRGGLGHRLEHLEEEFYLS